MGQQETGNFQPYSETQNVRNDTSETQERYALTPLRELDLENESDLTAYFKLLTHPSNIQHFSGPPKDTADLKRKLERDRTRAYIAENMVGEIVGAGGIDDAAEYEHDHFLVKVVVNPDCQGKGIGRQLVIALTDMAFSTKAVTITATAERFERERIKLDAAVIRDVEGWDRMPRLLRSLGYKFIHLLENQVTITEQSTGREVIKPTERYEIGREDWFIKKPLREKANGHPK